MVGACSMHGRDKKCTQNFFRECVGKRPLGRPSHRWEDSIKINLGEIVWMDANWIILDQHRGLWQMLVNMVMNLWVP
jgi:hypothetical protein